MASTPYPLLANLSSTSTVSTERRKTKREERQDLLATRGRANSNKITFLFHFGCATQLLQAVVPYLHLQYFPNNISVHHNHKPPYVLDKKKCFLRGKSLQICGVFRFIDIQKCPSVIPLPIVASLILSSSPVYIVSQVTIASRRD
jgi:hypothetical protein